METSNSVGGTRMTRTVSDPSKPDIRSRFIAETEHVAATHPQGEAIVRWNITSYDGDAVTARISGLAPTLRKAAEAADRRYRQLYPTMRAGSLVPPFVNLPTS